MELKRLEQRKYAITRQIDKYRVDYDEIKESIKFANDCKDNRSSGIILPAKSLSSLIDYTKPTRYDPHQIELDKENEISPHPLSIRNEAPTQLSLDTQVEWEDSKYFENNNIPTKEARNSIKNGKKKVNMSINPPKNCKSVASSNRTMAMNIVNEI